MDLVFETLAIVDRALAARASAGGIAALDDEAGYEAMEDSAIVVAVETVLQEVAGGERGLFGEEFEGKVARGGFEDEFGCGLGLEVVEGGHGGEFGGFLCGH